MREEQQSLLDLPIGWIWARLGDIAEINPSLPRNRLPDDLEVSFLPMKAVEERTGKFDASTTRRYGDVKKGYTSFQDGDIIFAKITPCMENGKIAVVDRLKNGVGFGSTEFHVLRPFLADLSRKYVFFFLLKDDFRRDAQRNMTGSAGQLRVPAKYIEDAVIPLAPSQEEDRIVAEIEELFTNLDAGAQSLWKVGTQLRNYRQAVLKYAFEGRLTEEWRESNKEESKPSKVLSEGAITKLSRDARGEDLSTSYAENLKVYEIPENWTWMNLGEVADFKNGINFNASQKGDKGVLTVDVLNMYSNGIYTNLDKLYRVSVKLRGGYLLEDGDILLVRSSVKREGVGWATLFKKTNEPVTFCGFIIRARLHRNTILPSYLLYFLRTDFARRRIVDSASQVVITNISQNSLSMLPFPLPPLPEQHKISEEIEYRFSVIDKTERIVKESIEQTERLRQSILKRAFEGRLIAQNPNDETADRLLERIRGHNVERQFNGNAVGRKDSNRRD